MIDYQKALNEEQYKVVTEGDGPCLVLAGAGSGKTRTLVFRVAYLLEMGVKPENILLVTFTNKAAKEMLTRVKELIGFEPQDLNGGTFHHMGNKILRKYAARIGFTRGFSILDQDDSISVIKEVMQSMNLNISGQNFPKPKVVQGIISYANNSNTSVLEVAQEMYSYPDFVAHQMDRIAVDYKDRKKQANAMDFDDLLTKWYELLVKFPEIKDELSKQFEYILVDEYQDTNYIQAAVIKELSSFHNNVLVVGDDSQSIYSFRAADVNNILNFPKSFPTAKMYRIETNYRSTPQILSLANDSIKNNQSKFDKALKPVRDDGMLPSLIPARDVYQQAKLVVNRIAELNDRGVDYKSVAVLFRATYQAAELQLELARRNIPYVVRGGMRYFEQAHIKDVVAYLKILANFKDEIAWKRILYMQDGIGQKTAEKIFQQVTKYPTFVEMIETGLDISAARAKNSLARILSLYQYLINVNINEKGAIAHAITVILERGYEQYVRNAFDNYEDRLDDLSQFVDFSASYEKLEDLLEDVMLSENFAQENVAEQNAVILSTIHQAKGLEWPFVMLLSVRDGDFPHHKSFEDKKQLEEERRLFYVAVTRARDELAMLYPVRKFSYQFGETTSGPSLFVKELEDGRYVEVRGADYLDQGGFGSDYEETIYYD